MIEIYTADFCPYCVRAKRLLDEKDLDYIEYNLTHDDKGREALVSRAQGRRTVPQIFINNQPVGGFDDLYAMEQAGELDKLLQTGSSPE